MDVILVLGASGYVGGRLVPELLANGYAVRCLARSAAKLAAKPWAGDVDVREGDLLEEESLAGVFDGVRAVFHLVHSMGGSGSFADADRRIAQAVAEHAERAGVERIVYLGGLGEITPATSAHLRSRAEVGDLLTAAAVPSTVLRAAVIIGSGSASFEMLRHLVEKLPVMVTPRWVDTKVQPIAIRDVLRYLVGVLDDPSGEDHVFDIAGPDVLTYLEMMQGYAAVAGLPKRRVLKVPVLTPALSSHWVNLVTPVPFGLAKPLVESLAVEVVRRPGGEDIAALVPGECLPYRHVVELALARIRDQGVETSWRDAELAGRRPADPYPGDPEWAGGTLLTDVRTAESAATPDQMFAAVCRIGGDRGWPSYRVLWEVRGVLDRLVGGVGLRRGRRDPDELRPGDALDFWRVEEVRPPDQTDADGSAVVRLRAEMRLPGQAWLEFRVEAVRPGRTRLTQRALFAPKGLFGRLYWWTMAPFHPLIFASMVTRLARGAVGMPPPVAPPLTSSDAPNAPPGGLVEPDASPDHGPTPSRRAG